MTDASYLSDDVDYAFLATAEHKVLLLSYLMMSSGFSLLGLRDYSFITETLHYKLEVGVLKDVGIYQTGVVL